MTDTNTTTEKAPEVKTVIDDMDSRRTFPDVDSATAYIQKCAEEFSDFGGYPVAAAGLTDDNEFDPEVYTDEMQVTVAVVTKRGEGPNSTSVHCIVIYPSPTLNHILANAAGKDWLTTIVGKELNHVAVRSIRKAENAQEIAEAVDSMPTTLADFVTSGRESSSGILETYNDLWQIIKKGIGGKSKPFALANLSKKELRKAMESASYAATVYPQLETRVNKKGDPESLFELAATFGLMLAKQESLDPTIFERMLSQRNEKDISVAEDEEVEFDLDAMAAALAKADAAAEPAAEAASESDAEASDDAVEAEADDSAEATDDEAEEEPAAE